MKKNLLYWSFLNLKNKAILFLRNKGIRLLDWVNNRQLSRDLSKEVFLNSIKTFIFGIVLVTVFQKIELLINDFGILEDFKLDKSLFQNLLMGGIGIAGVFLGLYYSNISAIYSSVYINAPTTLRNLFQHDHLISKNIKAISNYIILGFIFIGNSYINVNVGIITLSFWIIYSVRIVLTYSLSGNRSYELTDSFILVNNIYKTFDKIFRRVSSKRKIFSDNGVHYYLQKKATRQLSYINDISQFNINSSKIKGQLVNNFISANFVLIKNYWSNKMVIPYYSKWFKDKQVYKKWYEAGDSSISLALSTGTSLPSKVEQDFDWFEDQVMDINNKFYTIFIEKKELEGILNYFYNLAALGEYSAELNELDYMVKRIEVTQNSLKIFIKNNPDYEKNGVSTENLIDALMMIHIGTSIGINRYLSNINIRKMLAYATSLKNFNNADFTKNKFINNVIFNKLYDGIEMEYKIEKTKVTPDWYIKEKLSKFILKEFQEILYCINKIYRELVYDLGVTLFESKQYFLASLVFTKMSELKAKNRLIFRVLEEQVKELESILGHDEIVIEINEEIELTKSKLSEIERHVPGYLVKSTGLFTLNQEKELNQYPDMLGYSYNVVCEFLIDAIENNNIERFKNGYKYFLNIVLLYEDYIREDLSNDYESNNTFAVANVMLSPILEYCQISGYAYLWGEVSFNSEWKEIIEKNLESFIANKNVKTEEVIKKWIDYLKYFQNQLPAIYNRDLIRQEWSTRMKHLFLNSEKLDFEVEEYGNTRLKTGNIFLKSFLGNSPEHLLFNEPQDIYAIMFLNPKVDNSNVYISRSKWEERLKSESKKI